MSYFSELDAWLNQLFEQLATDEDVARGKDLIKQKVLESFRNGQRACPKCNPRRRQASPQVNVPVTA